MSQSAYLIKRNEDGKYVAKPGSEHSYTNSIRRAQVFHSHAEAMGSKCDNETVVTLSGELGE